MHSERRKEQVKILQGKNVSAGYCQSFPCVHASSMNHAIWCLTLGLACWCSLHFVDFVLIKILLNFEVTTNKPVRPAWYLSLWQLPHRACSPVVWWNVVSQSLSHASHAFEYCRAADVFSLFTDIFIFSSDNIEVVALRLFAFAIVLFLLTARSGGMLGSWSEAIGQEKPQVPFGTCNGRGFQISRCYLFCLSYF